MNIPKTEEDVRRLRGYFEECRKTLYESFDSIVEEKLSSKEFARYKRLARKERSEKDLSPSEEVEYHQFLDKIRSRSARGETQLRLYTDRLE
jgi:hypothetical protein